MGCLYRLRIIEEIGQQLHSPQTHLNVRWLLSPAPLDSRVFPPIRSASPVLSTHASGADIL